MSNIIQAFPKGSGGGSGHTILDSSGTAAAQESNLQFTGLSVTDDSANGKTEVAGEGLNAESINDIAEANSTVPAVVIGDANNYSTSEKVIGKWIDGKPLYQKTYINNTGTITDEESTIQVASVTNLNITNVYGYCSFGNSRNNVAQIGFYRTTSNYVVSSAVSGYLVLRIAGSHFANSEYAITIQYTKTTDI